MNKESLIEFLKVRNINPSDEQIDLLFEFMKYTLEANEKFNLTAIKDEETFVEKMIADSALALINNDFSNKTIIDVGTGAGFPGMVLKILCPDIKLTFLDSTSKKIDNINNFLSLHNMEAGLSSARVEQFSATHREQYDFAIARAVASLNVLLEIIVPLLKVGGIFIAMKAKGFDDELKQAEKALKKLNCELIYIYEDELPDCHESREILYIKKNAPTQKKYPRDYSEIKKLPL